MCFFVIHYTEEEVTVGTSLTFDESLNMRTELDFSLAIPEHMYLFSARFDSGSRNITITKDSNIIWSSNYSQNVEESDAGFTFTLEIRESVMTYGSEMTLTLSNLSNAYAFNLQMQDNNREAIYTNLALDLFPGQKRFDLTTETRSDFLPGYNTETSLNFMKTDQSTTLSSSLNVDSTDVVSSPSVLLSLLNIAVDTWNLNYCYKSTVFKTLLHKHKTNCINTTPLGYRRSNRKSTKRGPVITPSHVAWRKSSNDDENAINHNNNNDNNIMYSQENIQLSVIAYMKLTLIRPRLKPSHVYGMVTLKVILRRKYLKYNWYISVKLNYIHLQIVNKGS